MFLSSRLLMKFISLSRRTMMLSIIGEYGIRTINPSTTCLVREQMREQGWSYLSLREGKYNFCKIDKIEF